MGHHWQWPRPIRPYLPHTSKVPALEPMFRVSTVLRPTAAVGSAANGRRARPNDPAIRQRLRVVRANGMAALSG